jgi:HAD superfamily hydrolase (TIGR01509 family)
MFCDYNKQISPISNGASMTLKALIFDLDGTIIDTETPDYDSWREIYHQHGLELSIDLWKQRVGKVVFAGAPGIFDPEDHFRKLAGFALDETTLRRHYERYMELCRAQPVLPGVMPILQGAAERGIKLGVASNSDRGWVEEWLRHFHLRTFFECVRTRDDVLFAKPFPDIYLSAARGLGVQPNVCIAIEDSPTGMEAAIAAGVRCIAVPNYMTAHHERPAGVSLTLRSLAETTLDDLLARF